MIIATAGHIDHGKTLLVHALTGVDSDRLPEEKQRGMSIDLGFAYRDFGDGEVVGLVDVPGHERFIRNMLAGVTAVDCALLVVAADDGPMPQTREHLDILDLLGVERGVVALTKIDRVDGDRVEEVQASIDELLASTSLAGADIVPVCAPTGQGIDTLLGKVRALGRKLQTEEETHNFRLAIDRGFTVSGAGLVVTGHVFSGRVQVDDRLLISPAGGEVRVRGLHADDRATEAAGPGERCALNLAGQGVRRDSARRGQWVVAEPAHSPTQRIDARIRMLGTEARPLKHWTPVHVHLGTQDLTARVATLEGESIEPGAEGLVRLMLDRPIAAWVGDRFIVRDQSAQRTVAGGRVLDPQPPARGRAHAQRVNYLAHVDPAKPSETLARLTAIQPAGVALDPFARGWNLHPEAVSRALASSGLEVIGSGAARLAMDAGHWSRVREATVAAAGTWLEENPERAGIERERLRRLLPLRVSPDLLEAALGALRATREITVQGPLIALPGHKAQLPPADQALWNRIRPHLEVATDKPPTLPDLAKALDLDPIRLRAMAERAVGAGILAHINGNRFFTLARLRELAHVAERLAQEHGEEGFTAAAFRDASGIGRNVTIELLEYFDRVRLTRRIGNIRRLSRSADDVIAQLWSE